MADHAIHRHRTFRGECLMNITDMDAALEKGVYSTWHNKFVAWRPSNIGSFLISCDDLQLPTNSVLHIVDKFLDMSVDTVMPDLTTPFIQNETFQIYLETLQAIPGADALFPITEKYRFRPFQFNQEIRDFWIKHQMKIRRPSSRSVMLHMANALPVINYNAILTTQIIGGTFTYYRHFDILLRTILNTMVPITGKYQWLQIPLSRTVYTKTQFAQTTDVISYQTVRIKTDPSFYFLIHLVNFVNKVSKTSLFSQIPKDAYDTFNIVLTAGKKAIIYNLGDLKHILDQRNDNTLYQLVIRHINTLKLAGHAEIDITALDETDYDKLVSDVSPDDSHVVPDETHPSSDNDSLKHLVSTHLKKFNNSDDIPSSPKLLNEPKKEVIHPSKIDTIPPPDHTNKTPLKHPLAAVKIEEPEHKKSETEKSSSAPTTLPSNPHSLISTIDHEAQTLIKNALHISEEQRVNAIKVSTTYKSVKIDGLTIEEHLQQTAEPPIINNHLDFLKDAVTDPSMLNSTAIDLDKHYLDHFLSKDIASVVAHMATNGMFLISADQRDDVTQLSAIRHYKMVYQDLTGRRHTVSFKLPIVSPDGTITINGIKSRMIKQQVNLPICKIDSNRVSLASSYNKTLVERIETRAHNFKAYITRYISLVRKADTGLDLSYGELTASVKLPYDYSSLAQNYNSLTFDGRPYADQPSHYAFVFDYEKRFNDVSATEGVSKTNLEDAYLHTIKDLETTYGVYCGHAKFNNQTYRMFFGFDNMIQFIGPNKGTTPRADQFTTSFITLLFNSFSDKVPPPNPLSEWTELKILDKNFPVVFILGFEYGLQRVLNHLSLTYQFIPANKRVERTPTTIVVPFADGNLVFDRYPLEKSLVVTGLLKFKTKPYEFAQFNTQDLYYTLLQDAGISLNYLKGVTDFFNLFIDPITRDVLIRMHEPTEVGRLLVRATEMLSTEESIPSASMRNHRLRGYERFSTTLYNEMARAYASYSRQRGTRRTYSINPESVFLRLIQDQTLRITEEINPIENIKEKHSATYTGGGGRTAQSFVIDDRQFPEDAIGVLSEASPDNGKVGINTYITASPLISNVRGMFDLDNVNVDDLQPSQLLSVPSLLMPCVTNDDGKRAAFVSIQIKHHIPSEYSETSRIRTGYETIVAHRTGEAFACTVKRDGVVESIDHDLGLIKILYNPIKYPILDLKKIPPTVNIKDNLEKNIPILVPQNAETTTFKLHDIYVFGAYLLKVVDIIPTDQTNSKKMVQVRFAPVSQNTLGDIDIFKFGTKFTSAAGSFVKQMIVCNVHPGEHIKRGDVIAYNSGFFEQDPFNSKQVTWKHGVMANVVLMEANDTIEDSDAISTDLSKRLKTSISHLRTLSITANTIIRDIKNVGDEVQTTDLLCTLEDADIDILSNTKNNAMLDLLTSLNRKAPRVHYHGVISEVDVLYSCPISKMHPSLAAVVKQINAKKHALAKAASTTSKFSEYPEPSQVVVGTKYCGVDFDVDTVLFMFYISEDIDHGAGDKLVLGAQAKSVCASVIEKPISTESGVRVDMLFSGRSVNNRIITSPTTMGFVNRILEKLEDVVLDLYYKK